MIYYVIDFELNQAFDFPKGKRVETQPDCPFEIIQIGSVKLTESDTGLEISDCREFYVKPSIYTRIHPFVEKITGINSKMLLGHPYFPEVFKEFSEFAEMDKCVFCFWGAPDMTFLFQNILHHDLNPKAITKKYINLQPYASKYLGMPTSMSIGLKNAVEKFGIEQTYPFHNALGDALYTAAIFRIIKQAGIEMSVETLNISKIRQKSMTKLSKVNAGQLFQFAEKHLNRPLTDADKEFVLKIYLAGQTEQFKT